MPLSNFSSHSPAISFSEASFGIVDYVVFAAFLCVSGGIGIYFSCRGQKTTGEYFFGNRKMGAIPVGISTGVSFMSAFSIVGFPAELYNNGYGYIIAPISGSVITFLVLITFAHVIHPLKMKSLSEYYRKRFRSKTLSAIASVMVILCVFEYMGVCMFGAVVAFSGATGGQVSVVVALIIGCSVGVFYTSIGGLKAVIWTDVLQCGIMFLGIITVVIKSIIDSPGGMSTIVEMNTKYRRFDTPPLTFDMTIRHSMWSLIVGGGLAWGAYANQPAMLQRLISVEKRRDCYIVAVMTCAIYLFFSLLPSWAGINIFGYYASRGCDVYAAGWVDKNEILLYYIRDRLSVPGFQGLFVAALYAGSLSSLSSGLNSATSIIWNDLMLPCFREPPSEMRATMISKIIAVVFGVISMLWCYSLISIGGLIMQVSATIDASMYGAYFSLFLFAFFFRYANSKGAIVGLFVSFGFALWLGLSSLMYGKSHITNLPTTTANCVLNRTAAHTTAAPNATAPKETTFLDTVYSLSYLWFSSICILCFMLVAITITFCTKPFTVPNPAYLAPICRPGYCGTASCCRSDDEDDDEEETEEVEKRRLQI